MRRFDELSAVDLYDLLRLRVDVFVVEQQCAYPELDGRDREPETLHCSTHDAQGITAYLRVLTEPTGATRIGRVVTAPRARGRGLARVLLDTMLPRCPRPVVLSAQTYLIDLYASYGFVAEGGVHDEDGLPHVAMRLD